jgi:hypothetical protein
VNPTEAKGARVFESRRQTAEFVLAGAFVCLGSAILTLSLGPLVVGIFLLLLEHGIAAVGCALYGMTKGYRPLVGILLGAGLGVTGAAAVAVLPDESPDDTVERQLRLAHEGVKNARRDPGYEVLDDEDD